MNLMFNLFENYQHDVCVSDCVVREKLFPLFRKRPSFYLTTCERCGKGFTHDLAYTKTLIPQSGEVVTIDDAMILCPECNKSFNDILKQWKTQQALK